MALNDLFSNTSLADDAVVEVSDGKGGKITATVGEFRTYGAKQRAEITKAQKEIDMAAQSLFDKVQGLKAEGLLDEDLNPIKGRKAEKKAGELVTRETGFTEEDPEFAPLVAVIKKEMKTVVDEVEKIKQSQAQLAHATTQAISSYLDESYTSDFNKSLLSLPEKLRDDVKMSDVMDYAKKNNIKMANGKLNLDSAVKQLTIDKRIAYIEEQNSEAKKKLDEDKKALSDMSRPGASKVGSIRTQEKDGFSPVVKDKSGRERVKTLEEVIADAGRDDKLWDALEHSGASGIM